MRKLILPAAGVLLVVCIAITLLNGEKGYFPKLGGWGFVTVVTGSMEPVINVGDLVIVREEPAYFPGEIVVYTDGNMLVVHRITGIADGMVYTSGDHNQAVDAPIKPSAVLGKLRAVIPGVGKLLLFFKNPIGVATLLILAAGILLLPTEKTKKSDAG